MGTGKFIGMLNNSSLNEIRPVSGYKVTDIPFERIVPNEKNFYIVDNVEDIEEDIEQYGLKQPLEVFEIGNGTYKIIGGHRRYKAVSNIRARNPEMFKVLPCLITTVNDELEEKLRLIQSNATMRELTDYEKMMQATALKEIYIEMERRGYRLTGKKRDLIARDLNLSSTAVGKMENIASNATEEVKELYQKEEISTNLAAEVSKEPESVQKEFAASPEKTATALKEIKDQQAAEAKPEKKEKTDDDYGNTAIMKSDVEEIANLSMELTDEFEEEHIIVSGKTGKDIEKKLRAVKKNLEALNKSLRSVFSTEE